MRPRSRFACCSQVSTTVSSTVAPIDANSTPSSEVWPPMRNMSMYVRLSAGTAAPTATSSRLARTAAGIVPDGAAQPGRHGAHDAGLAAALLEVRARLQDQHDTGEAGVEVLHGHETAALAGVVDVHPAPAEAAAHAVVDDVVVELPEQDRRRPHLGERGRVHLHALGGEAVTPRRLQQVAGPRAVARDTAGDAQLLQRDVPSVVAEHHRERGGAALHGLHLEDGGCTDGLDPALGDRAFGRRGAAAAPYGRRQLRLRAGRGGVVSSVALTAAANRSGAGPPGGSSRRPRSWSSAGTAARPRTTTCSRTSCPTNGRAGRGRPPACPSS